MFLPPLLGSCFSSQIMDEHKHKILMVLVLVVAMC